MKPAQFRKHVENRVREALRELGFSEKYYGLLAYRISDEVIGIVGLNDAHFQSAGFSILPFFGLEDLRITKIASEFTQDGSAPHCFTFHLQTLTNNAYLRMEFDHLDKDVDKKIAEFIALTKTHVLPYMHSNCSLDRLVHLMDTESGAIKFHGNCKINIPIAYALLGNREKALELVRRAAKGYSDPKFKCREMADEYLYAARNFLKHFFPEEKELLLVSRPTVAAQQTVKDEKEPEA